MIRLLHTADIHLETPFSAQTPQRASASRAELRQVFADMVSFARKHEVGYFLICGDLFDRPQVSADTVRFVTEQISSLPSCRFILTTGNHDPYIEGGIYDPIIALENTVVFHDETVGCVSFDEDGVDIYGYGYRSAEMKKNPFSDFSPSHPNRINLLCGHGTLNGSENDPCPFTERELARSGFDYYAFGHIHRSTGVNRCDRGYYAYSGCPQGRDFGECGVKGAIYAQIDKTDGGFVPTFREIPFCFRRYEDLSVSLTGLSAEQAVADIMKKTESWLTELPLMLRITLTGEVSYDTAPICTELRSRYSAAGADVTLLDRTLPIPEISAYDPTLKGLFCRMARQELENGDAERQKIAALALRYGLAALEKRDIDL